MLNSAPLNPWIMSNGAGKSFIKFQPIFWFRKWSEKDVGRFCFFMQKLSDTLNFFLWKTDNIFKKDNRVYIKLMEEYLEGWEIIDNDDKLYI